MPRITNGLPKYRLHKASGNAVVNIMGRDVYLGPHGTKASKAEYDRLVGEWLAAGRPTSPARQYELTVVELAARYKSFAHKYYHRDGERTSTVEGIELTLKLLCRRYGRTPAADFGPLALQAMQTHFIGLDYCRRYVNDSVDRIKRLFRWAVANELVPPSTSHGLNAVPGLRKGRTEARESPPVLPVDEETVNATLPHLPTVVADMVRMQRLSTVREITVMFGGQVGSSTFSSSKFDSCGYGSLDSLKQGKLEFRHGDWSGYFCRPAEQVEQQRPKS